MAWRPAQKDVGITPFDWNFFFYLYTLAFASAFLVPYRKEGRMLVCPSHGFSPALRRSRRRLGGFQRVIGEHHFSAARSHHG